MFDLYRKLPITACICHCFATADTRGTLCDTLKNKTIAKFKERSIQHERMRKV